jgi:hypothetical protein
LSASHSITDFRRNVDQVVSPAAVGPAEFLSIKVEVERVGHPDGRVDDDPPIRAVKVGRLDPRVGGIPVGPVNPALDSMKNIKD